MDPSSLIAQWSGKLPGGFVPAATLRPTSAPECSLKGCRKPAAIKKDGAFGYSCRPCLDRRAASCRRRRAALTAEGGCRRGAYRKRLQGDFLWQRCREDRDIERAQNRQGRHRRSGDRRVRGQARDRAPRGQSRPRNIAWLPAIPGPRLQGCATTSV